MSRSTLHGILKSHYIEPHTVEYYLHKRDENFESDMKSVIGQSATQIDLTLAFGGA